MWFQKRLFGNWSFKVVLLTFKEIELLTELLKALSIVKILDCFCPEFCGHLGKRLDKNTKVSFKISHVTDWDVNSHNTPIAYYLIK